MDDILVPIALFTMIGTIFGLYYFFRHKTRQEIQTTIRTALERGQELSPELLDRLTSSLVRPYADLRKGSILIAIGIGFAGFAATESEPEILAFSGLLVLVGLTYLGLWYFLKQRQD